MIKIAKKDSGNPCNKKSRRNQRDFSLLTNKRYLFQSGFASIPF